MRPGASRTSSSRCSTPCARAARRSTRRCWRSSRRRPARGAAWPEPGPLVARLRLLAAGAEGATAAGGAGAPLPGLPGLPDEVARALSAHERRRLHEALGEGARAYLVLAEFDLADFDERYRRLSESLSEAGEVVATQPFINAVVPDRVGFRI